MFQNRQVGKQIQIDKGLFLIIQKPEAIPKPNDFMIARIAHIDIHCAPRYILMTNRQTADRRYHTDSTYCTATTV